MKFYITMFIASIIATYFAKWIAIKRNVIDIPNERSSHTNPTPRGGGIAFVGLWFVGITYEHFFFSLNLNLYLAMLSGLLIVTIGLIDDIWGVKPILRLFVQFSASAIALYFLGGLQKIDLGFYVFENVYILTPIALIAFVWFINLFNFLDGIDGYVGSETLFVFLFIFLLFTDGYALLFTVTILGFLIWNWQPAKIFMGDVGSTLIGFNVAIFMVNYQNTDKLSIFIFLILTSVFWFDATLTLFRRWRNKEKLSEAHKKHGYQRLTQSGFSHQKTSLLLLLTNLVLAAFALLSYFYNIYLLFFFLTSIIFLYVLMKFIDKRKPFSK